MLLDPPVGVISDILAQFSMTTPETKIQVEALGKTYSIVRDKSTEQKKEDSLKREELEKEFRLIYGWQIPLSLLRVEIPEVGDSVNESLTVLSNRFANDPIFKVEDFISYECIKSSVGRGAKRYRDMLLIRKAPFPHHLKTTAGCRAKESSKLIKECDPRRWR